jgi:hypothetical protein
MSPAALEFIIPSATSPNHGSRVRALYRDEIAARRGVVEALKTHPFPNRKWHQKVYLLLGCPCIGRGPSRVRHRDLRSRREATRASRTVGSNRESSKHPLRLHQLLHRHEVIAGRLVLVDEDRQGVPITLLRHVHQDHRARAAGLRVVLRAPLGDLLRR